MMHIGSFFVSKVVEGAAGVAIGAFMSNSDKFRRCKSVAIVACGANIATSQLQQILDDLDSEKK